MSAGFAGRSTIRNTSHATPRPNGTGTPGGESTRRRLSFGQKEPRIRVRTGAGLVAVGPTFGFPDIASYQRFIDDWVAQHAPAGELAVPS